MSKVGDIKFCTHCINRSDALYIRCWSSCETVMSPGPPVRTATAMRGPSFLNIPCKGSAGVTGAGVGVATTVTGVGSMVIGTGVGVMVLVIGAG